MIASALSTLGRRLVTALLAQFLPLGQIVGPLLLYVGLCVGTMGAMEFLCNRILDFDRFDLFVKCGEGVSPNRVSWWQIVPYEALERDHVPFFRGYNLDDSGLHTIFINLLYELWKAAKLVHSLY